MPQGSAINDILQMRQQGLSNNQIIQNLQRAGYTNTQIFDAMNQADTKMAVEGLQPAFMQHPEAPAHELFTQPPQEFAGPAPSQSPINTLRMDTSSVRIDSEKSAEKIEELVEAIIEEKWTEIVRDVNKIIEWKNKVETRLSDIEIRLDSLKDNFSDLNKAVISKVNEYDKHILEVGSDVRAMEKVFSKVLPAFAENVNELSRITTRIKEEKNEKGTTGR